jgi:hypothetical protein
VYHYRVVATSSEGTTNGGDQTFTTPGPPIVTTAAASGISASGATLNGTVNPTGLATTWWFEYGPTTFYGTEIPLVHGDAGSGSVAVPVSIALTGLAPGTTYHYRVRANNGQAGDGNDMTFTTLDPPVATTGGASAITPSAASVAGTVDPNGKATTFRFEYGTTLGYGSQVSGSAGSGTSPVSVSGALSGLAPSTTYHYRLVATNADGTDTGGDATFTTAAAPPPPGTETQNPTPAPPSDEPITTIQREPLKLALTVVPAKLRTVLARGLRLKGTCSATCTLTVKLVLSAKDAKRLRLKATLATVRGRGGTFLKLKVSKKNAAKLAHVKRLRAKLVVAAVGADGRKASLSKPLTLKR